MVPEMTDSTRDRMARAICEGIANDRPTTEIVDAVLAEMERPGESVIDAVADKYPSGIPRLVVLRDFQDAILAIREGK